MTSGWVKIEGRWHYFLHDNKTCLCHGYGSMKPRDGNHKDTDPHNCKLCLHRKGKLP